MCLSFTKPTGYTPCEQQELQLLGAVRLCKSNDLRSRSNLRSLACKQAYRLASLDYVASGSNRSGGRRPHPSWSTSRNKSRPWRVYHQNGVLYFTNTTWCISSSRRGYTMKRDEIQPKGLMIYTSLRVVMICQVCDLDKKYREQNSRYFWVDQLGLRLSRELRAQSVAALTAV